MIGWLRRLLPRRATTLSEAGPRDAAAMAALHAAAFRRGWSEDEFRQMTGERNVLVHRAMAGNTLTGFIISRSAAGEAEILSVAVARARQGRGEGRALLDLHLRRLAGRGIETVFLEVGADNAPARRLYARAGFHEVGQRAGYYPQSDGHAATALVLRRDLV